MTESDLDGTTDRDHFNDSGEDEVHFGPSRGAVSGSPPKTNIHNSGAGRP